MRSSPTGRDSLRAVLPSVASRSLNQIPPSFHRKQKKPEVVFLTEPRSAARSSFHPRMPALRHRGVERL